MIKALIGPQIRQIRQSAGQTQAEMARKLGISAAYVNLLENNQRSISVKVLMSLSEVYGVDARALVKDESATLLSDLRACVRDPVFSDAAPDLVELRAALDHAPGVVKFFLQLYENHQGVLETLRKTSATDFAPEINAVRPETAIHNFFRSERNHFPALEEAAEAARGAIGGSHDDLYGNLKRHLSHAHGIDVHVAGIEDMTGSLRIFDRDKGHVLLSEALDQSNRNFQLAHVLALLNCGSLLDDLVAASDIRAESGRARCRVELANYFAAAVLMPYEALHRLAEETAYDLDRIAVHFAVSFEQLAQRLTTLQRTGAQGVPFFFLRIDTAGNVTKRFNATPFTLAEQGGACSVWNIHSAFAVPDTLVPQLVELPDAGQFFTLSRTTTRPRFGDDSTARRLVVTLGCERAHMARIGYGGRFAEGAEVARIGINCHICPRRDCAQRAYEPLHVSLPIDANRRGTTRYQS